MERRTGLERRKNWINDNCPVDPECYFRTKQQVEINTGKLIVIEAQMKQILEAKLIAEGAVKGSKATLVAAVVLVVTSVSLVISIFLAILSGKLSLSDILKGLF